MNNFCLIMLAANATDSMLKLDDDAEDARTSLGFILHSLISGENDVLKETSAKCLAEIIDHSTLMLGRSDSVITHINLKSIVCAFCKSIEFVLHIVYLSFSALSTMTKHYDFRGDIFSMVSKMMDLNSCFILINSILTH